MAETAAISILLAMSAPKVWRSLFADGSWLPWRAFLAALFGLPMDEAMAEIFMACTGRLTLPTRPFSEAAIICGRRAGKSRILALIAVFLGCFVRQKDRRAGQLRALVANHGTPPRAGK